MIFYMSYAASMTVFITLLLPEMRQYFFGQVGRWLYIFLFALSLSYLITPPMRWLAKRLAILDIPEARKIHERTTPLLGGVAIIIAFSAALLANMVLEREIMIILYAGGAVAVVSLIDDWKGLRARAKLVIQILAVAFLIGNGIILNGSFVFKLKASDLVAHNAGES